MPAKCPFARPIVFGVALCLIGPGPAWAVLSEVVAAASEESRHGAHIDADRNVHFVVYAPEAEGIELLLFDSDDARTPSRSFPMTRQGDDWKLRLSGPGVGVGLRYMFRAKGPNRVSPADQFEPMFNGNYPLNDPYAYQTRNVSYSAFFESPPEVHAKRPVYAGGAKSVVYDHAAEPKPGHVEVKPHDLIVYELHVQDYTARIPGLDPKKRGTYVGLVEPGLRTPGGLAAGIDHLVELGVTAVELMPVMEYDEETGNVPGRLNHWGYMTTNFFAPESRYAFSPEDDVVEMKQLVKAFHDRGIAVFLDVVFNHTGEQSPWLDGGKVMAKSYNFMGLCNTRFYRPTGDGRFFQNDTGTGNDVDFSGPVGRYTKKLTSDSLSLWYNRYGIDGFRFDLARVLAVNSDNAADWVDDSREFSAAHLHAEPWDMGGAWFDFMDNYGYSYRNNRWAKWVGRFRDEIRSFSKSSLRNRSAFKRHLEGYGSNGGNGAASSKPWRSVNILAVHDGYTLRDTVYYNDDDGSHNCWDSGGDENLRRERQKLLLGVLFTSQGVPLILQGDEFGRTQSGALSQADAHNTYNYESTAGDAKINHVSWVDWRLKDGDNTESPGGPKYGKELFAWTRDLIALRKKWTHFRRADFPAYAADASNQGRDSGSANDGRFTYNWEGPGDGSPTQLAAIWWGKPGEPDLMVVYNESPDPFTVNNLADWSQGDWKVLARSWFGDDADFAGLDQWESNAPDAGRTLEVKGRSMAILISDND
jgi:glycogen operon protein